MSTLILKLGGAAITDKSKPDTLSPQLDALVDNVAAIYRNHLKASSRNLILIHGAGSFGHPPAKAYKVKAGWISSDEQDKVKFGMALTRQRVIDLHLNILKRLQNRGQLPVLSISTYDTVETDGGVMTQATSDRLIARVQQLLKEGFIPLLFGDAVLDHTWGSTILSGDTLMHKLATQLPTVERCMFVTDVAGIYTKDPKHFSDASLIKRLQYSELSNGAVVANNETSGVDDVTGAMHGKLQWAKRIMTDAHQVSELIICQSVDLENATLVAITGSSDDDDGAKTWTTLVR